MKKYAALFMLLTFAGLSSAWGPQVSMYVCDKSVERVFGAQALKDCIPKNDSTFTQNFCEVNAGVMGSDSYAKCRRAFARTPDIHPALISQNIFKDDELHKDFSQCPIVQGSVRWWICGDHNDRPAVDQAEKWFTAAETAPDLCSRIYDYCIAGSYYADSESNLHHVRNYLNDCQKIIEDAADVLINNNLTSWSAGDTCTFKKDQNRAETPYRQRLAVASTDVNRAMDYLFSRGIKIREKPLQPKNSVIILANSIDREGASGLYDFLRNNSVDVYFYPADNFTTVRYNPTIIILGGQNAPEGVGDIVSTILLREEKASLISPGARKFWIRTDIWKDEQNVIIIAGNEKEDTQEAWIENKDKLLSLVK